MSTTARARAALARANVPAPTDRQVEQVVSRAALALAHGDTDHWSTAALEVAKESRP